MTPDCGHPAKTCFWVPDELYAFMLSAPCCLKGTSHFVFSSTKSVFPHKSWSTSSVLTHVYINKKQGLILMILSSLIPAPLRHCISPFLLSNTCWRWGFASVATITTSMSHSCFSGTSATVCQSLQPGFNWFSTRLLGNLSEIRIWSCHRATGNTSMVSHPHKIKTRLPLLSSPLVSCSAHSRSWWGGSWTHLFP